jgi:hypothetical protein
MNYDLSVQDRLLLLSILPPQGDIITLKIIRDLQTELSFSEKEIEGLNLRPSDDGKAMLWDLEKQFYLSAPIGPKAKEVIANALKDMNAKKALTAAHIDLYERFVGEE